MPNSTDGFTLIELLIALTIAGLILGTGALRFSDFTINQTVRSTGLNFKNHLRAIQAQALAGIKPTGASGCAAGSELVAYRLSFLTAYTVSSQAVCQDVDTAGASQSLRGPTTNLTLTQGMSFTAGNTIDFLVLGKGVSANQLFTFATTPNPRRYYSICVTKGGEIRDCGYKVGSAPTCPCP